MELKVCVAELVCLMAETEEAGRGGGGGGGGGRVGGEGRGGLEFFGTCCMVLFVEDSLLV